MPSCRSTWSSTLATRMAQHWPSVNRNQDCNQSSTAWTECCRRRVGRSLQKCPTHRLRSRLVHVITSGRARSCRGLPARTTARERTTSNQAC